MLDLKVEYTDIRDDTPISRDGTPIKQKRVTFYLGKFGPFTERFDTETFSQSVVDQRVEQLRQTLRGLHQT